MAADDLTPGTDPGPDPEDTLRRIQESQPKAGCLGFTITGAGALVVLGLLVLALIYLVGRCVA
jgi:hypothetical protein